MFVIEVWCVVVMFFKVFMWCIFFLNIFGLKLWCVVWWLLNLVFLLYFLVKILDVNGKYGINVIWWLI